jgi:hypothetical protein
VGLTGVETWYWVGGNAIENVAYSKDVGVPKFTWRWFHTGAEINDSGRWIDGEPKQDFDQDYQTYNGCAAMDSGLQMKVFNCRTPLPYVCEEIREV